MMKIKEIREKDSTALQHELADRQKHLFEVRSQAVTEKLEDPSQIGKTRREIARIKTVLRERDRAAQKQADAQKEADAQKKQEAPKQQDAQVQPEAPAPQA